MSEIGLSQQLNIRKDLSVVVFGGGAVEQTHYTWGKRIVEAFRQLNYTVNIIEIDDTAEDKKKAVENNDIIFFAVPETDINEYLLETKSHLIKNKIILDCATNKGDFENTLKEIALNGASVCSTHPMVNPEIIPRGQNVILMPIGNKSETATQIAKMVFCKKMGMIPSEIDFDQHANTMVILQMVPHLIQRILIDAMGHGIEDFGMTINDVSQYAPANYLIAELGVGRVGLQKSITSANIVSSALQTKFGKKIFESIRSNLGQISAAGDPKELSNLFTIGINRLDPHGKWRNDMGDRTEVALNRLGNLRSRSCQVCAPNKPGILLEILEILYNTHNIDMTALDSQIIYKEDGSSMAHFDIGLSDLEIDFKELEVDLKKINCSFNFTDK